MHTNIYRDRGNQTNVQIWLYDVLQVRRSVVCHVQGYLPTVIFCSPRIILRPLTKLPYGIYPWKKKKQGEVIICLHSFFFLRNRYTLVSGYNARVSVTVAKNER